MVRHSRSHTGGLSSRDVTMHVGEDIPQLGRGSPQTAALLGRDGDDDDRREVEEALSREDSSSMRNCKIITVVWAVITVAIIAIAQETPGKERSESDAPLHWSAGVLRANRRASYFLDHRPPSAAKCNVRDFGAVGDGVTLDTMAFHKAIRACLGNSGEVVVPSPGVYAVEYVRLPSQARLHLESGAVLQGGANDSPLLSAVTYPFAPLLSIHNASDVAVTGGGTIRGRAEYWLVRRKFPAAQQSWAEKLQASPMVDVLGSQRVRISGVVLENSTGYSLKIHDSGMVVAEGLTVTDTVPGQEHTAILIDSVQTVEVTDSELRTGRAVAVGVQSSAERSVTRDVLVQNTVVRGGAGVGLLASAGRVSEVVFKGLRLDGRGSENGHMRKRYNTGGLLLRGGGSDPSSARPIVDKVLFQDVVGFNLTYGIDLLIDDAPHMSAAAPPAAAALPRLQSIEFRNITMDACRDYAVRMAGPAQASVRHVVMQDLLFTTNQRYGWDCTAEIHGHAHNVEPPIPAECALKPEVQSSGTTTR